MTAQPAPVVLVLGMHRSGTSALTRTLNLLGARLPNNLIPAQSDNQTGFWESTDVQRLNDRILAALGARWDDCRPLNFSNLDAETRKGFVDEIAAIVAAHVGDAPLALKDPRLCRLLPLWRAGLAQARARAVAILPLRQPWEVAASLAARNGMAMRTGLLLWLRHILDAECDSRGLPRAFVHYDELLSDWRTSLIPALKIIGLDLPIDCPTIEQQIDGFLRPELRHHVAPQSDRPTQRWTREALSALTDLHAQPDNPDASARLDALREEIDAAWELVSSALLDAPVPSLAPVIDTVSARLPPGCRASAALEMTDEVSKQARTTVDTAGWNQRFSVVMPTWNRRELICEAIDSVRAQSYPHWELIVSDDGSTDGTLPMLRQRYPGEIASGRLRLLENLHAGVSAARNQALRIAQGPWIAYLDSDNRWHPDYLMCMAAAYATHPHRRCAYAAIHVHDSARHRDFVRWLPFDWPRLLRENYIDINVFSHHRSLYERLGGFDETLRRQEDWDLVLRYTRSHAPQRVPHILCDYYLRADLNHLTLTESSDAPDSAVRSKHLDDAAATAGEARLSILIATPSSPHVSDTISRLRHQGVYVNVFALDAGDAAPSPDADSPLVRRVEDSSTLAQILSAQARDHQLWLRTRHDAELAQLDAQWRSRIERQRRDLQAQHHKTLSEQAKKARLEATIDRQRSEIAALENRIQIERSATVALVSSARTRTLELLRQRRSLFSQRTNLLGRLTLPPARLLGRRLSTRERLYLWRQARRLLASGLFDPLWYLQTAPDVAADGVSPIWHWLLRGAKEGRMPNPLFDSAWYRRRYVDVAASGVDPLLHYLEHGAIEGRDPGPLFSTREYLSRYPDVSGAGVNPLVHFLRFGQQEGRAPNRWFDPDWYLRHNPDVAASGIPPLEHFILAGGAEGRSPGPDFDSAWYLSTYPDVAARGLNPLVHYLTHGCREGRKPAPSRPNGSGQIVATVAPGSPQALEMQLTPERIEQARAHLARRGIGRFSIVMPTWNRAATIGDAIDAVLAQSYTDWELIVCDDGSTDNTPMLVAERYADALASGRLRYLRLAHGGVCAARNAGLAVAQGTWIAYLDSDNTWRRDYLLMMAAALSAHPQARTAYSCLHLRDSERGLEFIRCHPYEHGALLRRNFIDLNVFVHHRDLYTQLGGFDERLRRLVDWDLILRYTRLYIPVFVPFVLCDYRIGRALNNITLTEPLNDNERAVRRKFAHRVPSSGAEPLRLAYVLADWPASPQTYALNELQELRRRGIDVRVYHVVDADRPGSPDLESMRVSDAEDLAKVLVSHRRNWIHANYASSASESSLWTMLRTAAESAGVAFTFRPPAPELIAPGDLTMVRIAEAAQCTLCSRVMVHDDDQRRFLGERGVPLDKMILMPQAVDTGMLQTTQIIARDRGADAPLRILAVARFVESEGLEMLIEAAARLERGSVQVRIHGAGPLKTRYHELIRTLRLESHVRLCGVLEGLDALREALAESDVFCLPRIESQNGETDDIPRAFLEAIATGVPCLTSITPATRNLVSHGITGFLTPAGDPGALAAQLHRITRMSPDSLAAIAWSARDRLNANLGARHAVDALLDVCANPPIDVFMITSDREDQADWASTDLAIRSVLERTTTPMVLTIIDNGSDTAFLDRLKTLARGEDRLRIITLGERHTYAQALNAALAMTRSEFVFHVCSKGSYVIRHGWERPCLRYMRNHSHVAIAGHLVGSSAWPDGRGYAAQTWFNGFRNPEFALANPDRAFCHVHDALYVLRRSVFEREGGFSEHCPERQTLMEYCYFLESRGHALGRIPELAVLPDHVEPGIVALVDEATVAAHPVFADSLALLNALDSIDARCNICGWMGRATRAADGVSFDCPSCASSPHDRATFRWLVGANLHSAGLSLDVRGLGRAVRDRLAGLFTLTDGSASMRAADLPYSHPSRMLGLPPLCQLKRSSRAEKGLRAGAE
ncbi:glycosyltransferase [Sinimarinibacterium thermocellulolyticum]|uniref:Glycosyltransferase n=1 Tax=Sinimarinibacterium thermocellulolyticum TaxID=3170016 RepID=A0ABV2ACE4_9GAMM